MNEDTLAYAIIGGCVGFLVGLLAYNFMNMKTLNELSFYKNTCRIMEK